MPLQDQLDQYKQDFEAKAPAAAIEVMHCATRALAGAGILNRTINTDYTVHPNPEEAAAALSQAA